MARLKRILDKADDLGMAVILGIFYFGQDERLKDEAAVIKAVDNTVDWVLDERLSECPDRGQQRVQRSLRPCDSQPPASMNLIERVKNSGGRVCLSAPATAVIVVPHENVVRSADFLLIHGNGVKDPKRISEMVGRRAPCRATSRCRSCSTKTITSTSIKADYNMLGSIREFASWGYFDPEGYQSPPVDWGLDTDRKKAFFGKLKEITGAK